MNRYESYAQYLIIFKVIDGGGYGVTVSYELKRDNKIHIYEDGFHQLVEINGHLRRKIGQTLEEKSSYVD